MDLNDSFEFFQKQDATLRGRSKQTTDSVDNNLLDQHIKECKSVELQVFNSIKWPVAYLALDCATPKYWE